MSLSRGDVAIVPDPVGNCLVISGLPDAVEEVRKLVEQLDQSHGMILLDMQLGEVPVGDAKAAAEGPKPAGKSPADTAAQFRLAEKPPQMETIAHIRLTTLDNQPAYVQIGKRFPRITSTSVTQAGQTHSTILENFGTVLSVTPRISGDGTIVMQINVETSRPGPENEGTPIYTRGEQVVRSPRIESTVVQTVVRIPDGKTAALSSSAQESKSGKELLVVVTPPSSAWKRPRKRDGHPAGAVGESSRHTPCARQRCHNVMPARGVCGLLLGTVKE